MPGLTKELRCHPSMGQDQDALSPLDHDKEAHSLTVCGLLEQLFGDLPGWSTYEAFMDEGTGDHERAYFKRLRQAYREQTGRDFPPLFKVKLTIEAEELPEAEAKAWWEEQARCRAAVMQAYAQHQTSLRAAETLEAHMDDQSD